MKEKNLTWFYYGNGLSSFGDNDLAKETIKPTPKEDEILARVDAVSICASDVKMINLGNDYPLFKNRDFDKQPAILGHELSLTIVEVGSNLKSQWKKGMRVGVQPDVYMDKTRYCMGVNVAGGYQHYILLEKSIFYSDQGVTIFDVDSSISYASVAQLEPNACVEAAYRKWSREGFDKQKELLIYIGENGDSGYELDKDLSHQKVVLYGKGEVVQNYPKNTECVSSLSRAFEICPDGYHDILIIGEANLQNVKEIIEHMHSDAVFCWLLDKKDESVIDVDIAKIHYSKINWLGSSSGKLSDAFNIEKQRHALKEGGALLLMGGAGVMGRNHAMRAIMDKKGSKKIVITELNQERLDAVLNDMSPIAKECGKELVAMSLIEDNWQEVLLKMTNGLGFDDVVICAPGIAPVEAAVPLLKKDGMLVLFAGTKYGSYAKLPIGYVASYGARINASSGSSVDDQKKVLQRIMDNQYNLDKSVAAIAGFNSTKKAITAVGESRFSGKVIVYPQLDDLPLLGIKELKEYDQLLYETTKNGWNKQAEKILYKKYGKENIGHDR